MFDFKEMFYDFGRGSCESAFCETPFSGLTSWLKISSDDGGMTVLGELLADDGRVHAVFEAVSVVGFLMVFVYMMLFLYEEFTRNGTITLERFGKTYFIFAMGFVVILNGWDLIKGIAAMGDVVMNEIDSATSSEMELDSINKICNEYGYAAYKIDGEIVVPEAEDIIDGVSTFAVAPVDGAMSAVRLYESNGLGDYLGNSMMLFFINIGSLAISVIAITHCITRAIQLVVYAAMSPLAISNMFGSGAFTHGIRFLKKVLAIAIQGPVIYLICSLYSIISGAAFNNVGGIIAWAASSLAVLGAMKAAEKYANDIIV